MDTLEFLKTLSPEDLHDLYCKSQQVRDIVDNEYELYSKFWFGSIKPTLNLNYKDLTEGQKIKDQIQDLLLIHLLTPRKRYCHCDVRGCSNSPSDWY